MRDERLPCCIEPRSRCGTRWEELRAWTVRTTGKGVKLVKLHGDAPGRAPFHAQPVGYDGRSFRIAADHGCDTEKLLHELCHWIIAPRERRGLENYGLGPGAHTVDDSTADHEEYTVMLLERRMAAHFALPLTRIARPDYNVRDKRHIDRELCESRAETIYATLIGLPSL